MMRWMRSIKSLAAGAGSLAAPLLRPMIRRENMLKALGVMIVAGGAFFVGRMIGVSQLIADPVIPPKNTGSGLYSQDYSGRVVAYIYDKEAISREELAEFLITRFGVERLEFLVNKKIIDRACAQAGVIVQDIEVETQFANDLRALGPHMNAEQFQKSVLKPYNKTIFEWKEDVIRPKLMMIKYVQKTCKIHVDALELQRGYEARHGEMVNCRMIVYQNENDAQKGWQQIAQSPNREAAFLEHASKQFVPQLQAKAGEVPPIHKHFGDPKIEKAAFAMKTGEISQVFGMPDGTAVILLCQGRVAADPRPMEHPEIYGKLLKELTDLKLAQTVQSELLRLRTEARAVLLLGRQAPIGQVVRDVRSELSIDEPPFRPIDPKR